MVFSETKLFFTYNVVGVEKYSETVTYNFFDNFREITDEGNWPIVIHGVFVTSFEDWDNFGNFQLFWQSSSAK